MLVCHCKAVSDTQVKTALAAGARTPEDIGRMTGAGTGCGGCIPELRRLCERVCAVAGQFEEVA